jgi:hypothetical protein
MVQNGRSASRHAFVSLTQTVQSRAYVRAPAEVLPELASEHKMISSPASAPASFHQLYDRPVLHHGKQRGLSFQGAAQV